MEHAQKAEALTMQIKELEWQRDTVMVLAGQEPAGHCLPVQRTSPWE